MEGHQVLNMAEIECPQCGGTNITCNSADDCQEHIECNHQKHTCADCSWEHVILKPFHQAENHTRESSE